MIAKFVLFICSIVVASITTIAIYDYNQWYDWETHTEGQYVSEIAIYLCFPILLIAYPVLGAVVEYGFENTLKWAFPTYGGTLPWSKGNRMLIAAFAVVFFPATVLIFLCNSLALIVSFAFDQLFRDT